MLVHYHLSSWVSHRTAGLANMRALAACGASFTDDPALADAVVVHDEPAAYAPFVDRFAGRIPLVAYCVWETDVLPSSYAAALAGFDRIWTCSPHSAAAFQRAGFANVDIIPHVVEPPATPSPADVAKVSALVGPTDGVFNFLTVADAANPRKNLPVLLRAFGAAFDRADPVRLVVKQYRRPVDLSGLPNVIDIREELSDGEMAALRGACNAAVSAHRAEAWGLPLSEAMAAGLPVIATGHSGNMFYMDESNSLPVRFTLTPVPASMCALIPAFTPEMSWAEIDADHLALLLRRTARGRIDPGLPARARAAMRRFAPEKVGPLMARSLQALLADFSPSLK